MAARARGIFADRLSDLIKESGKEIRTLSEEIGISSGSLSNYQNAASSASIDALVKISDYFHVTPDYLLGYTDVRSPNTDLRMFCDKTGLDEDTVEVLQHIRLAPHNETWALVLNYVINSRLLNKLVAFFASGFSDDQKKRPYAFLGRPTVDSRVPYADLLDELSICRRDFRTEIISKKQEKPLIFEFLRMGNNEKRDVGWSQLLYDHREEAEKADEQLSIIAEYLRYDGYDDFMQKAGVNLQDFSERRENRG